MEGHGNVNGAGHLIGFAVGVGRVTFEVLGHFNQPQSQQLSEAAVNRLLGGTWMAICRNDGGNYHFTSSVDAVAWDVAKEMPFVPSGLNSKPTFDRFGGIYYLGWQEATRIDGGNRSVFDVDVSHDGRIESSLTAN
ncbi:hypothetical protein K227x_03700 [Rubripirellula lacrimiformis]|uniref:Uncharacterized protein n=2 Tax=Rubripirellula lacrimiformis TaxID=1930273 RepID=A0A517N4D7_9BACT|nr:hypothetical protein K227x_03700 [Rubripirellula lacrimiformis]